LLLPGCDTQRAPWGLPRVVDRSVEFLAALVAALFSRSFGAQYAIAECRRRLLWRRWMYSLRVALAWALVARLSKAGSSRLMVANTDSAGALSRQLPMGLIEMTDPASATARWYARLVYWLPRSVWCMFGAGRTARACYQAASTKP